MSYTLSWLLTIWNVMETSLVLTQRAYRGKWHMSEGFNKQICRICGTLNLFLCHCMAKSDYIPRAIFYKQNKTAVFVFSSCFPWMFDWCERWHLLTNQISRFDSPPTSYSCIIWRAKCTPVIFGLYHKPRDTGKSKRKRCKKSQFSIQ